jgi:hypothetical protein
VLEGILVVLKPEEMKKLHDAVVSGKLSPTGLPLDRAKLEALPKASTRPTESKGG